MFLELQTTHAALHSYVEQLSSTAAETAKY